VPMSGIIVELGAGSGWWSTLLAGKGELWMYEQDDAAMEQARKRLVSHGLLAHLHVRDPLAAPEREVDIVFSSYLMSSANDAGDLERRLAVVRRWLNVGGTFAFIETHGSADPGPTDGPAGALRSYGSQGLSDALAHTGFETISMSETRTAFVMGTAVAGS
jgi:hypothetical protein